MKGYKDIANKLVFITQLKISQEKKVWNSKTLSRLLKKSQDHNNKSSSSKTFRGFDSTDVILRRWIEREPHSWRVRNTVTRLRCTRKSKHAATSMSSRYSSCRPTEEVLVGLLVSSFDSQGHLWPCWSIADQYSKDQADSQTTGGHIKDNSGGEAGRTTLHGSIFTLHTERESEKDVKVARLLKGDSWARCPGYYIGGVDATVKVREEETKEMGQTDRRTYPLCYTSQSQASVIS